MVNPDALLIRARQFRAVLLLLGGVFVAIPISVFLWNAVIHPVQKMPIGMAIVATLCGLVMPPMAISRFGLVYVFDGTTRSTFRRRKFGKERLWPAGSISKIVVMIVPQSFRERESLGVDVLDVNGNMVERLYYDRTDNAEALIAAQVAMRIGHTLQVPVVLFGSVVKGTADLQALISTSLPTT
jgi:hypothetical protein